MNETEEMLKHCKLTQEDMLKTMQQLKEYYQNMEVQAEMLPAMPGVPMPTLLAAMDSDEKGRKRIVHNVLIPMDEDDASFTKYLQFYMELENPLDQIEEKTLLEMICWINGRLSVGCCILRDAIEELDQPRRVALRSCQGFPLGRAIDQGTFTEDAFLFDLNCDLVSHMLDLLAEGKTPDQVKTILMQQ